MSSPFPAPDPGLCGRCAHVRVIHNRKGSTFYLCERALTDSTFRRYPPLPVARCRGFEPAPHPPRTSESHE